MSATQGAHPAPTPGRMLLQLAGVGALIGILAATVLAVLGMGAASADQSIFASLIPAILTIGPAMAIPPFLLSTLGLMVTLRPPRSANRDTIAVALGSGVGVFGSPALFYTASPALALGVAVGLLLVLVPCYVLVVRRSWRRAAGAS